MKPSQITLSQLVTWTQNSTQTDVTSREILRSHAVMFMAVQGKLGLKVAREWLLGVTLLELHNEAAASAKKTNS
jgi:hypothetical protein